MDYHPAIWFIEGKYTYNINDIFSIYKAPPMQFTWISDKNGRDIYEGDIVQSTRPAAMKYKVMRDDEVAWFLFEDEFKAWFSPYGRIDVVIIGNIYENPELLKQ